ncbi:MAG: MFS transporter [Gemmobacter sp.]
MPIGGTIGLALGGWINDVAGWRQAFFIVGLPGIVVAVLAWFILPAAPAKTGPARKHTPFMEAVKFLFRIRSFRHMAAASSLFACGSYAMNVFAPAFLMRTHEMSAAQAGLGLGLASGIGGVVGTFAGGFFGDLFGRRDARWRQLIPAAGMALCVGPAVPASVTTPVSTPGSATRLVNRVCVLPGASRVARPMICTISVREAR